MNFVPHIEMLGVKAVQIPCIVGKGAPTAETAGAVGLQYMDDLTGSKYKCIGVSAEGSVWVEDGGELSQKTGTGEHATMSQKAITDELYESVPVEFENGNLNSANGSQTTAPNGDRLRSGYINIKPVPLVVSLDTSFLLYVYVFDSAHSYLGTMGAWLESVEAAAVVAKYSEAACIRLIAKRSNNAAITMDDVLGKIVCMHSKFSKDGVMHELDQTQYFQITEDGVLSLKPEYRGAAYSSYATRYPDGVSDQGVGVAGSLNSTLPEHIIIPEVVNEIAVTSLVPYMFGDNMAVKNVVFPAFIKNIPEKLFEGAKNLREIYGGENVETLGSGAFQLTGVRKVVFPKLKTIGEKVFKNNPMLVIADLGNEITEIPTQTFYNCAKLSVLRNGEKITSVCESAFNMTRRLKNLPFLSQLEKIEASAFVCSRVDYDWSALTGCTIGDNAVSTKWNPTDFWSACTPTPCENPIKSTFNQRNPLWVNNTIGNTELTYKSGCVMFSAAIVYSALADKELSSPMEFEDLLLSIDPTILDEGTEHFKDGADQWLEALGFTTEYYRYYTSESLQKAYDALAEGAMILTSVITTNNQGHASVLHGVNEAGEVMCVDPNWSGYIIGDYRVERFAMPIQNLVRPSDDFLIVRKK